MTKSKEQNPWCNPIVCSGNTGSTVQQIVKLIERNYHLFGGWTNAFEQVLDLTLYALSRQEDKYMRTVKKMDKRAVTVASQILGILMKVLCYDYCIWDYLGEVYMQIASMSKSKVLGQFFTPFHVCVMMARVQLGDIKSVIIKAQKEHRKVSIMEPCVGSGAMLLACKKVIIEEAGLCSLDHFEFFGQDIDPVCVKMCRIQMTLTDYRYMTNLLLIHTVELQRKIASANESAIA